MLKNKVLPCPYINPKLFYDIIKLNKKNYKQKDLKLKSIPKINPILTKTTSRDSIVTSRCVGHRFSVSTGKLFFRFLVSKNIVGYKFGEFSYTRKRYYYKNKKKKRRRKNA